MQRLPGRRKAKRLAEQKRSEKNASNRWENSSRNDGAVVLSLVASLKVCSESKDLLSGSRIHDDIVQRQLLAKHVFLGNALISMYVKCGALDKAENVFCNLPVQNVVSWNAILTGYIQHKQNEQGFMCFQQMQLWGFAPDEVTFVCILKACAGTQSLEKGQEIHRQIVREKLLEKSVVVANGLIDMYMKCGSLEKAQTTFDQLLICDTITWNTLIAGYAHHGQGEEAVHHFKLMQDRGFTPTAVTFICALKACSSLGALGVGQEIHSHIIKEHLLDKHLGIANALIDMYAKGGAIEKAKAVFDGLWVRDIVSWNALMVGYSQHGYGGQVINWFNNMQNGSQHPNAITCACVLKACGNVGELTEGQNVHAYIIRECFLDNDSVMGNALVYMYTKCGSLEKAQEVFNELPFQDIVSWTALISGYAEQGYEQKAFRCFEQMQVAGVSPNEVTFSCILKACSSIGVPDKGQEFHSQIVREHVLEGDVMVNTALVNMYATCGLLAEAQELFDKLPVRDAVLWAVLMTGYTRLGKYEIALNLFDKMIEECKEPKPIAFTIVLNICCRKGLVNKAEGLFELMRKRYGVMPTLEHHTCMINLLGQAGHFDKAVELIKEMSYTADLQLWLTLLSACEKWGDFSVGRWAFEQAAKLEDKSGDVNIGMNSIFRGSGKHEDAEKVGGMRICQQVY